MYGMWQEKKDSCWIS